MASLCGGFVGGGAATPVAAAEVVAAVAAVAEVVRLGGSGKKFWTFARFGHLGPF